MSAEDDGVLGGPPNSVNLADHEDCMLRVITKTNFWRKIDEHVDYWKSSCSASLKTFTFEPLAEEEHPP